MAEIHDCECLAVHGSSTLPHRRSEIITAEAENGRNWGWKGVL